MSEQTKRIQRQRTKGWRMPGGAIYVGRPTVWGNPFPMDVYGRDVAVALYRMAAQGMWSPGLVPAHLDSEVAYRLTHNFWDRLRARLQAHPLDAMRVLRGADVCCWCPLDRSCHADVILELANVG